MNENKISEMIASFIQQNSNTYSSNELFGVLSLLVLIQISEIFKLAPDTVKSTQKNNPQSVPGNITGLLSQLQNNKDGNLQQMLPMLLGAL
ncbi:MAG TPA: hypothetical protein VKY40_06210, partial [Halanaerobiales bacterium]|nr:hypothetical protein [Halanaerobiales bacterium]